MTSSMSSMRAPAIREARGAEFIEDRDVRAAMEQLAAGVSA
jgi:hypothetical protein